jgi:pro-sigmaK processing inhibitor BofA
MQFFKVSALVILSVTAFALLVLFIKSRRPVKALVINAFSGIITLILINLTTAFTGIHIPVNWWSVSASAGLGIPGVIGLILLQMIFS